MKQDNWYNTPKWKQKRNHILRRDEWKDQLELRAGKHVPAETVHHILPREKYPEYQWCDWNLISVSNHTHRYELHDMYGNLTEAGKMLMYETAHRNDIPLSKLTLIIGLPETGKTTLAKRMLKDGLCYDLDYIAGAFRLSRPHEDNSKPARKMANSMMKAFSINARKYVSNVYVIRTAPTQDELEAIEPDEIIVCNKEYDNKRLKDDKKVLLERIKNAVEWAKYNNVHVRHYE